MKKTFTLLTAFCMSGLMYAQNLGSGNATKIDVGLKLGVSYGLTDVYGIVGRGTEIDISNSKPAIGTYGRYQINDLISVSVGFNYFTLVGDDSESSTASLRARNLSFKNNILDLYARGELYFYNMYNLGKSLGSAFINKRSNLRFYAFAGVGGFSSNPKATLNNTEYELRKYRTEGQAEEYSKWNLSIPFGVGGYYTFNGKWKLGLEMGWRKTFTDYLDDVSGNYPTVETMQILFPDDASFDIAVALSNRNLELTVNDPDLPSSANYGLTNNGEPPLKRGNSSNLDSFGFTTFTACYIFGRSNDKFRKRTKAKF